MKLNLTHSEKIRVALDAAQEKCSVRLITADDLHEAANEAEFRLDAAGIPKKWRKGVTVEVNPNAHKLYRSSSRKCTVATLTRGTKDWFVTNLERADCWQNNLTYHVVNFPQLGMEEAAELAKAMLRRHDIRPQGFLTPEEVAKEEARQRERERLEGMYGDDGIAIAEKKGL